MFELRPYQQEARDLVISTLTRHRSALVVMPTGTGKTEVYLDLAVRWPGRVMVIGHRDFLIDQPIDRLRRRGWDDCAQEMGENQSDESGFASAKIVFASVQSLHPSRLARFRPEAFSLLVVDEAHRATAPTYRRVIEHFARNPDSRLAGFTASPRRGDGVAMRSVFEVAAFEYSINQAIADGWLVPVRGLTVEVDGLDFSRVKTTRRADGSTDFSEEELEQIVCQEKPLHEVAASLIRIAVDEPGIVFCCSVKHAQVLAAVLDRYRSGCAAWLSGESPPEERDAVLSRYMAGRVQFLCNVALFTEGFDAPRTSVVVWAAPTKSLVKYVQGFGRGTRPASECVPDLHRAIDAVARRQVIADSAKPHMLCVDYVGNSELDVGVQSADVLGGEKDGAVREHAKKIIREAAEETSVDEALERAEAEIELWRVLEERRRQIKAVADFRTAEFSPIGGAVVAPAPTMQADRAAFDPAPGWLVRKLVRLGVAEDTARRFHRKQAFTVLNKLEREGAGRG